MKYKKNCSCGCDVRGLQLYELHGYKENFEKHTFVAAVSKKIITDFVYFNGQEHILGIEIGYFDNKEEAIEEGKKLIKKYKNSNIQEFKIYGDDLVYQLTNK
jgi:hypothetical protein